MKHTVSMWSVLRVVAVGVFMAAAAPCGAAAPVDSNPVGKADSNAVNPCLIEGYPYEMDFENDTALGCVVFDNANGDNVEWQVVMGQGVDSSRCAKISFASPNDDYIRLPRIAAPGRYVVEWSAKAQNSFYGEAYQVLLGDSLLESCTVYWDTFHRYADTFRVAEGDTVGVSFRCVSDDRYALCLDDLAIRFLPPPPEPCTTVEVEERAVACMAYLWHGMRLEGSGSYADTVADAVGVGCDSVYTLLLRVGHPYYDTTVVSAADSFEWHGVVLTHSGYYSERFTSAEGCDSVETLVLTITGGSTGLGAVAEEVPAPRLYPTLTTGRISLEGMEGYAEAELYDLAGRRLMRSAVTGTGTSLDLGSLPAGLYLLRLSGPRGVRALRVERL